MDWFWHQEMERSISLLRFRLLTTAFLFGDKSLAKRKTAQMNPDDKLKEAFVEAHTKWLNVIEKSEYLKSQEALKAALPLLETYQDGSWKDVADMVRKAIG